ncbi:MAG: serine hydrolase [Acidobacteria bacterium]|nr:serine hydrolase [Acidobacteriota bacterium]
MSAATTLASGQQPGALQRLLQGELSRIPAKAGIYVRHLKTGEEAAVLADERFNSASVIKIPAMVMAYQMAEKKTLDLDARVTIGKADKRGGSGVLRYHDVGLQPTVRDVVMQMIITSDNTATDMAFAKVGGVPAINAWLQQNGYAPALRLNATILEVFRNRFVLADPKAAALTAEDVYALGSGDLDYGTSPRAFLESIQAGMRKPEVQAENLRRLNDAPDTWLGVITPRGVGRLIEAMETGKLTSAASAAEMSRVMRWQQSGARRLPHFIDVPVGHKTGDFPPSIANDVGVIYTRSGPVVVSFLLNGIREPYAEAEDRMGQVARLIVEYFDGQ